MSEMEDEDAIHAEREEDDWADGSAGQHDQEEGEGARPSARVLYDLLDLSPKDRWTYDEEQEEDVRLRRLGPLKLAAAQLQWFWQELVPAALSELGLSSLYGAESVSAVVRWAPAALRQHRRGAPEWTLALSPAGDALAIVQNLQVSFRYAADNFRITKMTWKMPAPLQGPASQWRYCAWTEDSKYFAVGTVTGLVYVLQKGSVKHTFDVRQLGMGKALAGLAFRRGGPVDRARRGLELILITHERKVWRLPLPKLAIGIDPASPDIRALDVSTYHHSVGAIAYYSRSDLLAIAGGPHPLGDRSKDEGSLSLWHLSDNAPHFVLAHSTMHATHADHMAGRGIFAPVTQYFSKSKTKAIYHKAVFSPSGDKIAVVDLTGRVDVHTTVGPSYTQLASWSSEELSLLITSLPPATSSRVVTHVVDLGWWSDELLLLAFATGEVIISPLHHLQNLLGLSGAAEIFEKQPSVTSIAGHKAFILECRQQSVAVAYSSTLEHRTNRRPADTPQELSTLRWLAQWLRNYAWEVAEHFWSPDWWLNSLSASMMRRLNLRKTYRLLALRQTTPLKLCLKLLQQERYEEALNLAQVYNLNTDLVYQKQWAAAPVSPESVKNYLNRIYDQRWVLWECHRRVPNEPQAVELLLEYGLQHTVPTWMYEYRASDSVDRTGTTASSSLSFGLTKPVAKRLSGGDKELCLHRLLFLQYLDRLRTFRQIIKDNEFCASTFLKFRSCELLAAAKEYARDENFDAVEVMLARHLELLVPHLLEILSQCPETTPPSSYERLLPPFLSLPDKQATPFRESDWVEEDDILAALGISSKNDLQQMYSLLHASSSSGASPRPPSASSSSVSSGSAVVADATRQDFRNNEDVYYDDKQYFAERVREETLPAAAGMELSLEQIERWYQDRAKEIDETSGQLENALILIECGLRRGVKGLEAVHNELVTLSSLVYDDDEALQHTHTTPTAARSDPKQLSHAIEARASSSNAFITFHRFHDLSDDAKLHLLLADSTDATLMRNMKTRALPFLQRLRKRNIDETSLLRQWMVSVAQGDRFHWCALIIQASRPTKDNPEENRIIQSPLELMRTALEVVYACPATSAHAIQQMGIIFESLPERVVGATEDDTELHSRADRLEKHLNTNEILLKYELAQPMSFFEQYEANPADLSTAHALLHRMAQKVVRGGGEANQVWIDLLRDMLIIRDQVFTNIGDEFCYRLFCSTLLHTGRFELAAEYLRQLGRATAEDLIVEAARLHFNSAASPHHREMAMAKRCLSMVPLSASLAAERDLIDGVKLLSKLGLHLLPVQIRLRLNAVDQLVAQLLETNPEVYKEVDELQQVGSLLGASVETKEKISLLIARAAFEQHDYETAHEVCQKLMSLGNTTVSAICADLARAQDYRDVRARLSLASFALSHCEVTAVGDLLALYRQLEARVQADATLAAAPLEVNKTESEATTANEDEAEQGIVSTMLSQELQVLSNATAAESRRLKAARFFPTHPFYSPQHHQEHKESMEETPHTEIGADEALLRLSLVAGGEGPDPSLVARLARANAHVDLPLTFAYLAAADQDDAAGELFEDMANRARDGDWGAMRAEEERWRLAGCYYFALRCLIYLLYAVPSLTLAGVDQSLFHDQDMASVVQRLQDLLDGRFLEEHKVNVAPIEETLSRFKSSYARLCTARQERQLAEVSGDVDKDRLTTDEVYGKEVLLGLGRTSKKAALTVAFTLARRYTFPEYLVAIESLEHTLRNPEASAQSFTDLATFLAPRLQNADADAVSVRLQQMACSGLRSGALLRLLRQLTSCSPALSSLFGSGPSSLALLYESALTHLLAAATQNAEAWQEELLPPPSFSLAEKDMAAITSQAHEAPDTPSSLLPWDPVPRSALLPSLLRLLASLCGEDENDSTTALAQHIESARRSVSGRLRAFLNPDAVSTEEQQVQLSLPDVRGRIIVGQALDYWAQHDAPHAWWHRPQAETSHENRDGDPAPTHDATTLARHRATAILLTTWPDLGQYDVRASLHSAEERVALFDRLLESSPSAEQIQNLAQLLLLWMEEGKSVWRASWARLLGELVRLEEDVMLISLRRGPTSRFLDQAEEEAIAAALSARQSTADPHQLLRVYCKFCLLSRYPSLADAAVERMVQESATDENVPWVDAELLATIVASPHLPRFTTTPYFPHLTRHLLREGAASTLALAASSLCIARQHLCAAALVGRALALATPLRTAHNALALLARFLRSHATTDATCAAALHQLSSDCPPPPAIAGQP